tara:strand:+ start:17436 stop:18062 length:627 start_codon:yes stop_codon:yes gene_type:complete
MVRNLLDDWSNMTRTETKKLLIQVGTEVLGSHGFNPTGLNTVLKTAGVPKGSFYYYFASKEDFGLAVIDEFALDYAEKIDAFLSNENVQPLQRIRDYLENGLDTIREGKCKRGCLIGTLGQELSSQNETFRLRLDQVFEGWKQQFIVCLQAAIDCGELPRNTNTEQFAEFLLSGWQGAVLSAKMHSSTAPLQAFIDTLFQHVLTKPQN